MPAALVTALCRPQVPHDPRSAASLKATVTPATGAAELVRGTPSHRYLRGVRSRGGRSLRRSRYRWRLNPRRPGATSCRTATERQRQSRCSGGLCDSVHHRDAHSKLVHRGQRAGNALLLGMDARQRNAGSPRRSSHRITHSFAWRSARQVPPGGHGRDARCNLHSAVGWLLLASRMSDRPW